MANHFSSIGFKVQGMDDISPIADQAITLGSLFECAGGVYYQWPVGDGIELWLQTSHQKHFFGMNPHFFGSESGKVRVVAAVPDHPDFPLDGGYHVWAAPADGGDQPGAFPFIFQSPDALLNRGRTNEIVPIQLAAFAHEVTCFSPEEHATAPKDAFLGGMNMASKSFIPTGLFGADQKKLMEKAEAIFMGEVKAIRTITNPVTKLQFIHARVASYELEIDVVADLETIGTVPPVGHLMQVSGWLSGRILLPSQASQPKKPSWLSRLIGRRN